MCLDRAVRDGESFPRVRGKVVWKAVRLREGRYEVHGGDRPAYGEVKLGEIQVPNGRARTLRLGHSRWNEPEDSSTYPAGIHVTARRADAMAYGKWNWGNTRPDIRILRGVLLGKVLFRGIQEGLPVLIVDKVIWLEDVGPVFGGEK